MRLELQQDAITIIKKKNHNNLRFFTKCMFAFGRHVYVYVPMTRRGDAK